MRPHGVSEENRGDPRVSNCMALKKMRKRKTVMIRESPTAALKKMRVPWGYGRNMRQPWDCKANAERACRQKTVLCTVQNLNTLWTQVFHKTDVRFSAGTTTAQLNSKAAFTTWSGTEVLCVKCYLASVSTCVLQAVLSKSLSGRFSTQHSATTCVLTKTVVFISKLLNTSDP